MVGRYDMKVLLIFNGVKRTAAIVSYRNSWDAPYFEAKLDKRKREDDDFHELEMGELVDAWKREKETK